MKKVILILICILLCGCNSKPEKHVDLNSINEFDFSDVSKLNFDIHSKEYMIVRLSDFKVLYQDKNDIKIYPASLTKIMTLNAVLHNVSDLSSRSSFTYEQLIDLINDDASLAGIKVDYEYTIEELLYALILPSGADAAIALSNYFEKNNMNLVEKMNEQLRVLGCNDTNFVNVTGLHDDNHYSTLDDLLKIVMDTLSFEQGRKVLETLHYKMEDNTFLKSSLGFIHSTNAKVLGGKTGYTDESGQSVLVLYKANGRSYLLIVANAEGSPRLDQYWHYEDAMEIMKHLY